MNKRSFHTALIFSTLLLAWMATAHAYDWKLRWTTIETEHFSVHYHTGLDETGQHVAEICENIYQKLTASMGWEPRGKTQVVVNDNVDFSNGSYSPVPYNVIRIYITQPGESSVLDNYEDWLEILLTHEYLHNVHIDTVRGLPRALRGLFGRIFAINGIHPNFMIEGLAVYYESLLTGMGRGNSTDVDMMVRMATLEDRMEPLSRWTTRSFTEWPSTYLSYNFGAMFHLWVAEKYGHKFDQVSRLHSGQIFPWLYNHNMKKVFGKKWSELYKEFKIDMILKYNKVKWDLEKEGITKTQRITRTGYRTLKPKFSPDGWYLAWIERTPHSQPRIIRRDLATGKTEKLLEDESVQSISWSPLGRQILYTRQYTYKVDYVYDDLFLYDTLRKKRQRLTKGARVGEGDFAPDRSGIVFVHTHDSTTDLGLLHLPGGKLEMLTKNPPMGPQYSSPRFAPNGKKIAVSVRTGGNRDIYLFDLASRTFERITYDNAIDESPAFSPDGRVLYFSSNRTGISNIFAFDLEAQNLYRVTNVLGCALEPDISPDGKTLAFTGYSSYGYDIHTTPIRKDKWVPAPYREMSIAEADDPLLDDKQDVEETAGASFESHKYRPWWTLLPRWWLPYITGSNGEFLVGLITAGTDVLYEHSWSGSAWYWTRSDFMSYSLNYANRQWYPTFNLGHGLTQVYLGEIIRDNGEYKDYYERRISGSFGLYFPFTHEFGGNISYRIQDRNNLTDIPESQSNPPDTGLFSGVNAGLNYSNTRSYGYSVAPEKGGSYEVDVRVDDTIFGSDYDIRTYTGHIRQYFGIPKIHHVISINLRGGLAEGDTLRQRTFRMGGNTGFFPFSSPSSSGYYLRGYERSAFRGQRAALGTLSYRFPIWRIERGIGVSPFWFDTLSGVVFGEAGSVWDGMWDEEVNDIHPSAGAELALTFNFSFGYWLTIKGGVAQGFSEEGTFTWITSLGTSLF